MVMRVVVAKGYNRSLARPLFNCPACFEQKEQSKSKWSPTDMSVVPVPSAHPSTALGTGREDPKALAEGWGGIPSDREPFDRLRIPRRRVPSSVEGRGRAGRVEPELKG